MDNKIMWARLTYKQQTYFILGANQDFPNPNWPASGTFILEKKEFPNT